MSVLYRKKKKYLIKEMILDIKLINFIDYRYENYREGIVDDFLHLPISTLHHVHRSSHSF